MMTQRRRSNFVCAGMAIVMALGVTASPTMVARATVTPPLHPPTTGPMSYDQEFTGADMPLFDRTFWWGGRWLNHQGEQEVYVDPTYRGTTTAPLGLNSVSIVSGMLQIQAAVPTPEVIARLEGQHYTSGIVTTYTQFNQLYGYFEICAKIPAGSGFWPTFWLMPKVNVQHPPEIDILEAMGDRTTALLLTVHNLDAAGAPQKTSFTVTVPDMSAGLHRYGLLWTKDVLAWYFDGVRVAFSATPADMHAPMYMLLNLAVGSDWGSQPDVSTKFPGNFLIDYIRVYPVK